MKNLIKTALLMLAIILPTLASAYDIQVGGLYYNINGNEATVTYYGYWDGSNYYSVYGDLIIPESITYGGKSYPVTAIDNGAFSYHPMTSIEIPNTITHIGQYAFEGCCDLKSVIIPNSVISIGDAAFVECEKLSSITIGNSVSYIGWRAFLGTPWYDNQPNGLIYAGKVAYEYKGTLPSGTNITLEDGTLGIACGCFSGCSGLSNIEIPNSVICVGYDAFFGTAWYDNQPDGMVYINDIAYSYKGTLPEDDKCIILKNGTKRIAGFAFGNCGDELTSVLIPNSVISIDDWAFNGCTGLTNIEIPNSVTSIGYAAFCGCTGLTSIEIPYSVVSISDDAFNGCNSLTSITIPNSMSTIGNEAFAGCTSLTSVEIQNTIPNSVTSIGAKAFIGCYNLSNVSLGNSVNSIRGSAFSGCRSLTSIDIPNSVKFIGDKAFDGCTGLASINISNSVTAIARNAFTNTPWYNSWLNNQPDGLVYIGSVAFKYKGTMPSGTSIRLKEGTLGIADGAFSNCSGLVNIEIPNSITSIGENVFYGCTGLTDIYIPNSVTGIGWEAFCNCSGLKSVVIPNSVTYIDWGAFASCSSLTNIEIPNSVSAICDQAFVCCYGLTKITIPKSVTYIGSEVFNFCSAIQDIYCYSTIPQTLYRDCFSSYSATLHVPASSLAAYFTAPVWSNFENIVGDAVAPTGISVSEDSVEIQLGEQFELVATIIPTNASNKEIYWRSSDTTVATVEDGIVTTVGVGDCDIIATCFGMQAICHMSVFNKISMEQEEAILLPNHMLTLTPTAPVMPEGFKVSSSDPTVAAARVVNGKVQIVGIKEGTTTITVGSTDGTAVPATCLVTVFTEPGDVNMDGYVDISDITQLIDYLLGTEIANFKAENANFNGDAEVNIADVTAIIDYLLSPN